MVVSFWYRRRFLWSEEKSFPTKKDLNKWVKENLDVIK